MDNTATTTLKNLVDNHTFINNPLDVFDSYTYTLEWFVCDREATRKYSLNEAIDIHKIVKDGWPGPTENYITIAKTGVTTEFNITDLSVESVGVGNSDYSKIAGTAYKVNFTVTQIGNTSLSDSLQNVVALCGFTGIGNAEYFIKINFVGHTEDGKTTKLQHTKVIPFKLINYQQLNTTTDQKGTTTMLSGQVPADKVVMDSDVANIEHNFSYNIGATLEDTLKNFFAALNKSVQDNNEHLKENMKHTYSYEFSKQLVEDRIQLGKMKGKGLNFNKSTKVSTEESDEKTDGKNKGKHVGSNVAGNHIYKMIEEICFNSENLRKETIKNKPGLSKVPKITPHLAMKVGGYNPVKGTQAYDVIFFIDYEKKIVYQNMPDKFNKMRKAKEIVKEIFEGGHVNKKYDYLFTGNNDQILDFNISLDAELTKIYSEPEDLFAYEYFKKGGLDGIELNEDQQSQVDVLWSQLGETKEILDGAEKISKHALENLDDSTIGLVSDTVAYMEKMGVRDYRLQQPNLSLEQLIAIIGPWDDVVVGGGISERSNYGGHNKNHLHNKQSKKTKEEADKYSELKKDLFFAKQMNAIIELQEAAKKANKKFETAERNYVRHKDKYVDVYGDIMATQLNNLIEAGYNKSGQQIFDNLPITKVKSSGKNLILAENLDRDFISNLSNEDFQMILQAQASNPITFRRLIGKADKQPGVVAKEQVTMQTEELGEDAKHITMAREKYYEAKGGRLSMQNADMTIKGDPFWLEGYMPPKTKKDVFEDKGFSENYLEVTNINGFPHIILKSGAAKGVDENQNIMTRTMIFSLYIVTAVTSNFRGGTFEQTLSMVKVPEAEHFPSEGGQIVKVNEVDDKNYPNIHDGEPIIDSEAIANKGDGPIEIVETNRIINEHIGLHSGEPVIVKIKDYIVKSLGEMRADQIEKENEKLDNKTESIKTNTTNMVAGNPPVINFVNDAIIRQAEAAHYMEKVKGIKKQCEGGTQSVCDQLENSKNDILAPFGLTTDDIGKLSTATTMNNAINNAIAGGAVVTQYEVAMLQHTAGIPLNITGHDPEDIERIIRDYTNERTPTYHFSSLPLGASLDNAILSGESLLNVEETEDVNINTDAKTWEEKKAYDDLIRYPNSNNDWKNTYWFKEKVNEITDESCPKEKFNPDTRRLECTGIKEGTLTDDEVSAINSKVDELDEIIFAGSLRDQHGAGLIPDLLAKQYLWTDNANEMLNNQLDVKDLILNVTDKVLIKNAMADKINSSVMLDGLTDDEYQKAAGLVNDINAINSSATDGSHRSDLTSAVHVGQLQHELETLSADATASSTNLDGYYFDNTYRDVEVKNLEELELQMAIADLSLPAENMTGVATMVDSNGTTTYIPINNPVDQIEVDQAPILVKTGINTADIILPGSLKSRYSKNFAGEGIGWQYAMTHKNEVAQYNEAKKIYQILVSSDYGDMTTVTDDLGQSFQVKDFSNIGPITYTDANGVSQTISNPSAYFGIHTTSYNDINPSYGKDYNDLKGKVADLFPDIESGLESQLIDGKLPRDSNGVLSLTITGDKFFIDSTP